MAKKIVEKTKLHSLECFRKKKNPMYSYSPRHMAEVEKWAKEIMKKYPEADKEIVLLSVWLHDIGQFTGDNCNDHAIESEIEAKRFLTKLKVSSKKIKKVAHCVRAHRCKDVQPKSLEAKILATADSASHLTDFCYIDMVSKKTRKSALDKLERDYRDIGLFPKLQKELLPLYKAWKKLLIIYPRL